MNKAIFLILSCLLLFTFCKKSNTSLSDIKSQLYPLDSANIWIYVDSFFDVNGTYIGKDTFQLKTAKTIHQNNHIYTPIVDQYSDSIFTIRSDSNTVFILEPSGETLMFMLPLNKLQPLITNYYLEDTVTSFIDTTKITTTSFPSYKIIIINNDGLLTDYKQQELYFTIGKGIIKGRNIWKDNYGNNYISDSYTLISYSLY